MSDKRQDIISGLLLPFGQALLTGVLVAMAVVSIWKMSQGLTGWRLFAAALSGSALLAWLLIWGKWRSWVDAEHGITAPQPEIINPKETVRVELQHEPNPYLAVEWLDLPIKKEQLVGVCFELLGRHYETSNLGGAGKSLTRAEAERFRDYLIAHNLALWLRPEAHVAGWRLNGAGRALVRRICDIAHTQQLTDAGQVDAILPRDAYTHMLT